jgi:hypothetical protein
VLSVRGDHPTTECIREQKKKQTEQYGKKRVSDYTMSWPVFKLHGQNDEREYAAKTAIRVLEIPLFEVKEIPVLGDYVRQRGPAVYVRPYLGFADSRNRNLE